MLTALDPLRLLPASSKFPGACSARLWARAAPANRHDHLYSIRIPHAKFRAETRKTVAVHMKQRTDRHTDTFSFIYNTTDFDHNISKCGPIFEIL